MQNQKVQASNSIGTPMMNRNSRRMFEYNMRKYNAAPVAASWADEPGPPILRSPGKGRPTGRSKGFRKAGNPPKGEPIKPAVIKDQAEITPTITKASKEVLRDEPMWQEGQYTGTQPVSRIYSQNADFSTFPLLCERVYGDLEAENPRLRREVPFCAFQHVYAGILNATIIDHVRTVNAEDRYADEESPINLIPEDMVIPAPIAEYYRMVANTTTPQGDMVKINIPDVGIPRGTIPPLEAEGPRTAAQSIPSGSFGRISAADHNKYECYVSPYVTSRLVLETREQNETRRFQAWKPLPDGAYPSGAFATMNLLGYRPQVERLNQEGIQAISNFEFPDNNNMSGRLRWAPELVARVSSHLQKLDGKYKMKVGRPEHGTNSSAVGWTVVHAAGTTAAEHNQMRLSTINGPVRSSVALGSAQCNIVGTFGLKRERTADARGLCYTTEQGTAIPGWAATINANFAMSAPFVPYIGVDMPGLRNPAHENASPSGDRSLSITTWTRRNFIIRK